MQLGGTLHEALDDTRHKPQRDNHIHPGKWTHSSATASIHPRPNASPRPHPYPHHPLAPHSLLYTPWASGGAGPGEQHTFITLRWNDNNRHHRITFDPLITLGTPLAPWPRICPASLAIMYVGPRGLRARFDIVFTGRLVDVVCQSSNMIQTPESPRIHNRVLHELNGPRAKIEHSDCSWRHDAGFNINACIPLCSQV